MSLVSTKVRYALHGLAYIEHCSGGAPVSFEAILKYLRAYSPELTLSPSYLAKIFQDVSRVGLTEALSGPRGGYRLARPAEEIRLIDVVEALDGRMRTECCLLSVGVCPQHSRCGVGDITREAEEAFFRVLEEQTIASLAARMSFPQLDEPRSAPATGD